MLAMDAGTTELELIVMLGLVSQYGAQPRVLLFELCQISELDVSGDALAALLAPHRRHAQLAHALLARAIDERAVRFEIGIAEALVRLVDHGVVAAQRVRLEYAHQIGATNSRGEAVHKCRHVSES